MKKQSVYKLQVVSANNIAKNLKKGVGKDRALKVADNLVKNLSDIKLADINPKIFGNDEVRKNLDTWTQVRNILRK